MQVSALKRSFTFQGVRIEDPDPRLSPEEVRGVLAPLYPDIATAAISGPEVVGDKLLYSFSRAVGVKG
jgi:PRTRC genetic system protein C